MWASAPTDIYNRTQILCTIGESVDAFCIPRQRVLPAPCAATATDGSVVPRRRRCSPALQRDSRVLAAMFFYGLIQWLAVQSDPHLSASFCPLFLARQKKWVCEATAAASPHQRHSGETGQKGGQAPALFLFGTSGAQPDAPALLGQKRQNTSGQCSAAVL